MNTMRCESVTTSRHGDKVRCIKSVGHDGNHWNIEPRESMDVVWDEVTIPPLEKGEGR